MIYVACPYWHKNSIIRAMRVRKASKYTKFLIGKGSIAYSPITHGHSVNAVGGKPVSEAWWRIHGLRMLNACVYMHILTVKGWDKSAGIKQEISYAKEQAIDIFLVCPKTYIVTPYVEYNQQEPK